MKVQKILIEYLLEPLGRCINKISKQLRDILFMCSLFGIMFLHAAYSNGYFQPRFLVIFAIDCVLFGVMILCGLTSEMRQTKFNLALLACWLGVGFFMFLSGILVISDYFSNAILFLIAFPVLYLVWNGGRGWQHLFRLTVRTFIYSFPLFLLVNIIWFPVTDGYFYGFFINPNTMCVYLTAVFACALFDRFCVRCFSINAALDDIVIGIAAGLVYCSGSRGGFVAQTITLIFCIILNICLHHRKILSILIKTILPILIAIVLLVPATTYVYGVCFSKYYTAVSEHDPSDTVENVHENIPAPDTQEPHLITAVDRIQSDSKTLNDYTSGRFGIWKMYIEDLNLIGNYGIKTQVHSGGSTSLVSSHLTVLQVAFESGVPAGVLYLAVNLLGGILAIIFAFRKRDDIFAIFPFIAAIAFGVYSLLEALPSPFTSMLTMLYYLSLTPLMAFHTKSSTADGGSESGANRRCNCPRGK